MSVEVEQEIAKVASAHDVGAFLAVLAALLLDNVLRLDESVSRVTDLITGSGRPDRELVVALQSFDRLKQEFEALGETLTRYAEAINQVEHGSEEHAKLGHNLASAITVADLKDRLIRRLTEEAPIIPKLDASDPTVALIDVDVVF